MEAIDSDSEDLYIVVVGDVQDDCKDQVRAFDLSEGTPANVEQTDGNFNVNIEIEDLKLEPDEAKTEEEEDGWEALDSELVNEYVQEMQARASSLQPVPDNAYEEIQEQYKADTILEHKSNCRSETADLVRTAREKFNIYKTNKLVHRQVRRAIKVPCSVCGKMICNANMKLHMEVHSDVKKFWCPHCTARFRTKRAIQAHLNAHSGKRPYRCDECPRAYTSDTALRAHKMDHGEKTYKCEYCDRAYSRKHTLKLHLTTHSDGHEYLCTECGKVFNNQYGLDAHTRQHRTIPNKFTCMDCGKMYTKMTGLNVHMKKKHGHQIITRKMFFNTLPLLVDGSTLLPDEEVASDTVDDPDSVENSDVVDKDDVLIPSAAGHFQDGVSKYGLEENNSVINVGEDSLRSCEIVEGYVGRL